ncbi:MAG: hypothetical protein GY748_12745 [Planctomycetaceae bacterium]|nr:hypothetical protein [Planctomycetaceae bacterium]
MDPNQGDQFNNDDVDLGEALVREVIQNSSDAASGTGPIKVRFQLSKLQGNDAEKLGEYLQALRPHIEACKFDCAPFDNNETIRILAIEDFNTVGLTGRFDAQDGENFASFWRNFARSNKSGKEGGRWGLGKLVFSSASQVRAFFGMTKRHGDAGLSLMGQTVLEHHDIGDITYHPHGFWFADRYENTFQRPISDQEKIEEFSNLVGLQRAEQSGLSILIPYLANGIDEDAIISGVVANYYFPILSGKLEVEVGETVINSGSFLKIAQEYSQGHIPFGFVKEVSDAVRGAIPDFTSQADVGKSELSENHFSAEEVELLKEQYASGNLVSVRVPVLLRPKNDPDVKSYIDLYLKSLPDGDQPFALFSRGPIILSRERRQFLGAMALGALVANDQQIAQFLGDAENPAHTRWNPHAEKLKNGWRMPQETLATIRHSLKNLYDLIAEQEEMEDTDVLLDFFSIKEPEDSTTGQNRKSPKPKPFVEPHETAIRIQPKSGGFQIYPGPGAAAWKFPRIIRIRLAYDMIGANPFKRYSPFDFDLQKGKEIEIKSQESDVRVLSSNILALVVTSPEFHLDVVGFDTNRDLIVEARAADKTS